MSRIKDAMLDPEFMAEQFGYKRGYQECQAEMSFKCKQIIVDFFHRGKYSFSGMITALFGVLDGK